MVISAEYVAINGYKNNHGYPHIVVPAHETVEEDTTIESMELCYYCELMGENTIRDVGMMISVYEDPDGDGEIDSYADALIGESNGFVTTSVDPLAITDDPIDGMEGTVIYDDGSFRISYLGVGDDLFGLSDNPLLYISVDSHERNSK